MIKHRTQSGNPNNRIKGNWIAQNSALYSAVPVNTVLQDEIKTCRMSVDNTGSEIIRKIQKFENSRTA